MAFQRCHSATDLLNTAGLFEYRVKIDQKADIATDELLDVFKGTLWAYYFSVIRYSPAEVAALKEGRGAVQTWRSAIEEVEGNLSEHDVPEKYFSLFQASIKKAYPETLPLSVWQATDKILNLCKVQIANRYSQLVSSRFPWDHR